MTALEIGAVVLGAAVIVGAVAGARRVWRTYRAWTREAFEDHDDRRGRWEP